MYGCLTIILIIILKLLLLEVFILLQNVLKDSQKNYRKQKVPEEDLNI